MRNPFKDRSILDIYSSGGKLKWTALTIGFLISTGSIVYTDSLVKELKERESKTIDLYAKSLEYVLNETNNDNLTFINQEIIVPNNTIPVIYTDANKNVLSERNINYRSNSSPQKIARILKKEIAIMEEEHPPIVIELKDLNGEIYDYNYVFYKNSKLLSQLRFYPYVQLSVIAVFVLLAYLAFSYSKKAEQNRVWIGMAKETAHQLGTPLSSLMAWLEHFRQDPVMNKTGLVEELDKDVKRLEMITSRFSNIGSIPVLANENMLDSVNDTVSYLRTRLSSKVNIKVSAVIPNTFAMINKPLFDWVIENICKNAVDAMGGVGEINIRVIKANEGKVFIDISDTGIGMTKQKINQVFQPGFTTKKRGWGLGLALAKRIIENYHQGRIFVRRSEIDAGTTFRIILGP